jgi:hypothetical protein
MTDHKGLFRKEFQNTTAADFVKNKLYSLGFDATVTVYKLATMAPHYASLQVFVTYREVTIDFKV